MTLLLEAIDAKLRSIADLTTLVGNRIFGNQAPQWTSKIQAAFGDPFPRIVYEENDIEQHRHLGGSDGSALVVVTMDIYSIKSYLQAKQIKEILRENLDTFKGTLSDVEIDEIQLDSVNSGYESPVDGSDTGAHLVSMDFFVWHQQTEANP